MADYPTIYFTTPTLKLVFSPSNYMDPLEG